jgi:hypothetical protein
VTYTDRQLREGEKGKDDSKTLRDKETERKKERGTERQRERETETKRERERDKETRRKMTERHLLKDR